MQKDYRQCQQEVMEDIEKVLRVKLPPSTEQPELLE